MRLKLTFCCLYIFILTTTGTTIEKDIRIDDDIFGQLGFAGNYAGISNLKSELQFESLNNNNSILIKKNDQVFEKIYEFNGNIDSTCKYKNFIYFANGVNIIKFDLQTNEFQPLNNLNIFNGTIYSLYCDESNDIMYIGGNFTTNTVQVNNVLSFDLKINNSTVLPWKGLNGPVYTITKNKKSNTILFGGRFDSTGDGQYFNSNTSQIISMSSSTTSISSGNGALSGLNSNPSNIVCPAKLSPNDVGQPWYLQDGVPGYWDANFANPVEPTVFRLSNTQTDRGTISFNILALGINDYFNLSYIDPVTQQTMTCSEDCILSNATYQDFTVLDSMKSNGIRININSWFGSSGGLSYVQIYQSDISVHPHLYSNDTQCNPTSSSTQTTVTGDWKDVYVFGYYQTVLVADVSYSELSTTNTAILYEPNIPAQGQYEIYATTPGCVGSSNCFTRTQVEYQLQLSPGFPSTTVIADQNVYEDKRFLLYSGPISPVSPNFRPSIILKPASNATRSPGGGDTVQIMADTIEFVRNMTAPSLVSVLEYSPANNTNSTAISWKPLNQQLPLGSTVYTIDASDGDILYIGGLFSSANNTLFKNIVSYNNALGQLLPLDTLSGVNGKVSKLVLSNSNLFVGGEFNSTSISSNSSLNHIAQFNTMQKMWTPFGDGVDGPVTNVLVSSDNSTLTISGLFTRRFESLNQPKISMGNALWSLNNNSWIERSSLIVGQIIFDDDQTYYAGSILGAQTYRTDLVTSSYLLSSRFIFNQSEIITAGVTWINNKTNEPITIIATSNNTNSSVVSMYNNGTKNWIDIDSYGGKVLSLATFGNWLYVGGQFTPTQGKNQSASLAIYDLSNNNAIVGVHGVFDASNNPGSVNVIKIHPDGKRVLIGGQFSKVGLLECDAVCVIDPSTRQWDQVAYGLTGSVNDMIISNSDNNQKVTIVGNLNVQSQPTNIASISNSANTWALEANQLPGTPITAVNSIENEIIVSGSSKSNASDFYVGSLNGETYTSLTSNLGPGTNISQLLLVPISGSSEQRYPSGTQNMLLAVGNLNINTFGNSSAALYDGTTWHPYLLTTQYNGQPGIINKVIHVTDFNGIKDRRRYLSIAAVILISIAISTGILFLMSAAGLLFLFKQHKNARGPDDMPPWTPSNRLVDALGLFGTGSLGAATIAATAAGAGSHGMTEASTTGRNFAPAATAAGPSNTTTNRSVFHHDDGDMGFSPTTTIVNPLPITAAAAAAGILSFDAMVASAKSNSSSNIVSETHPKLFYAKYPFKAQEFGELSLDAGETIVVTDTTDNVWWLGYKDGGFNKPLSGVFPSNYVKT